MKRSTIRGALIVVSGLLAAASMAAAFAPGRPTAVRGAANAFPPLCAEEADPDHARDTVQIHCRLETGDFAPPAPATKGPLTVVAYNVERGVHLEDQLRAFAAGTIPAPDVLLLSEADRGCTRSGERNVARDYARALGMNYVFAVEFMELPRWTGRGGSIERTCEHGNAILSRFPLTDPVLLRHRANRDSYVPPSSWQRRVGEPRLGGRATLAATVGVGAARLRAYSVHLEWAPWEGSYRDAQAAEVLADAQSHELPVVVGGDWNGHAYAFDLAWGTHIDPVPPLFLGQGFHESQGGRSPHAMTHGPLLLDLIYARGGRWTDGGVCARGCDELSDHRPVWGRLDLGS